MEITCEFRREGGCLPLHFHKEYEIIYISKGKVRLFINGCEHFASENDIVILSNNDSHSLEVIQKPYERYIVTVSPSETEALGNTAYIIMHRSGKVYKGTKAMFSTFNKMMNETAIQDNFSKKLLNSCIYELLASVCRENKGLFEHSEKEDRIFKIQKYIDDNFKSEIRISEICKMFFISRYYLTHTFSEVIGCSPKNYIMRLRLNNAGRILKRCSVSEAAYESGFADVNNFIKYFKYIIKISFLIFITNHEKILLST